MPTSDRVFWPVRCGLNYKQVNKTGLDKYDISTSNTNAPLDSTVHSSIAEANINMNIDTPVSTIAIEADSTFNTDSELDSLLDSVFEQPDVSVNASDVYTQSFDLLVDLSDLISQALSLLYSRDSPLSV
jgi:hypothetical protein